MAAEEGITVTEEGITATEEGITATEEGIMATEEGIMAMEVFTEGMAATGIMVMACITMVTDPDALYVLL